MSEYQREDLRRLVINNLSIGCNEAIVYELVLHFGPVHRIVWPSEQSLSGEAQRKTYCFVDFFYAEDAKYCYQMLSRSGVKLLNEEIRVSHLSAELKEREQGVGPGGQGSSLARRPIGLHEIGAKVIVKGIDSQATEFEIQTYFERFGSFAVPPRLQRTATGKFRGIAILSYKDFAYSDKAIELAHDKVFKNRIISVQYAELEDGSGRLHGSEEEREKAAFIQEEERKYQALLDEKNREAEKQNRRENTSWADPFHASRQYNR